MEEKAGLIGCLPVVERDSRHVNPVGEEAEVVLVAWKDTALHEDCKSLIEPSPRLGVGAVERTLAKVQDVRCLVDGLGRCSAHYSLVERLTAAARESDIRDTVSIVGHEGAAVSDGREVADVDVGLP